MYVLPKHVRDVEAHEGLRPLMADGRLRLVLWDEFPWYQVRGPLQHQASAAWRGERHAAGGRRQGAKENAAW